MQQPRDGTRGPDLHSKTFPGTLSALIDLSSTTEKLVEVGEKAGK